MDSLIYLDNAATTAVKPEVFEQMMPYFMDTYSNPASVYSFAGKAKKAVDDAREQIANVSMSTAPMVSSTLSYVSFCPRLNATDRKSTRLNSSHIL